MLTTLLSITSLLLLLHTVPARAGVVIGGTRFIYSGEKQSITMSVHNKSDSAFLVNTRVLSGGSWPGSTYPEGDSAPFIATPPLFVLQGKHENSIRLVRTGGNFPEDRESLFTLSIASIPSGKVKPNTVQMAVRTRLKLLYRPARLKGNPEQAYTQLRWSRVGDTVVVENPTPYYVTLFQLSASGRAVSNAGVVAPFAKRQENWCGKKASCQLHWQSINDFGRVMPAVSQMVMERNHASP